MVVPLSPGDFLLLTIFTPIPKEYIVTVHTKKGILRRVSKIYLCIRKTRFCLGGSTYETWIFQFSSSNLWINHEAAKLLKSSINAGIVWSVKVFWKKCSTSSMIASRKWWNPSSLFIFHQVLMHRNNPVLHTCPAFRKLHIKSHPFQRSNAWKSSSSLWMLTGSGKSGSLHCAETWRKVMLQSYIGTSCRMLEAIFM